MESPTRPVLSTSPLSSIAGQRKGNGWSKAGGEALTLHRLSIHDLNGLQCLT